MKFGVISILKNAKKYDGKIVVAVSGGSDSVALLHYLSKNNNDLIVAHVNHNLRTDSNLDEDFVKKLSHIFNIPFYSIQLSPVEKNIEAWGREKRYEFFERIRKEHNFDYIATAHHLQDNIETFLIKLLTGKELKGIKEHSNIIRPFIDVSKEDILEYLKYYNLVWVDDSSNNENKYLRNKIRNKVIPNLQEVIPDLNSVLKSQIENYGEIDNYFDFELSKYEEILNEDSFGDKLFYRKLKEILLSIHLELGIRLLQKLWIPYLEYRLSRDSAKKLREFFILERQGLELPGKFRIIRYNSGFKLLKN